MSLSIRLRFIVVLIIHSFSFSGNEDIDEFFEGCNGGTRIGIVVNETIQTVGQYPRTGCGCAAKSPLDKLL
jgi:hypothetical protein